MPIYSPSHFLRLFTALSGCWSHHFLLQGDLSTSSFSLIVILPLRSTRMHASDHTPLLTALSGCRWRLFVMFSHTSSQRSVVDNIITSSSLSRPRYVLLCTCSHTFFVFSHRSSPRYLVAGLVIACRKPSLLHFATDLSSSSHCQPLACLLLVTFRCSPRPLAAGGASHSQYLHFNVSACHLLALVLCTLTTHWNARTTLRYVFIKREAALQFVAQRSVSLLLRE